MCTHEISTNSQILLTRVFDRSSHLSACYLVKITRFHAFSMCADAVNLAITSCAKIVRHVILYSLERCSERILSYNKPVFYSILYFTVARTPATKRERERDRVEYSSIYSSPHGPPERYSLGTRDSRTLALINDTPGGIDRTSR